MERQQLLQSTRKALPVINNQRGFSLIEIILAVALFSLLVTALAGSLLYGQEAVVLAGRQNRAEMLAEEGLEAVRNIRDANFNNLSDGTYGLNITNNKWTLSGSSDLTGVFTRQINISTVDSKRKKIISTVTWQRNLQRTGSVVLTTRLTNWLTGSWSVPMLFSSYDVSGTNDGLKIKIQGNYAYILLSGGSPNFLIFDISNLSAPNLVGSLSLIGAPNNISVAGNFVFITGDSTHQLQIINVSTPSSPTLISTYNPTGAAVANGIFANGSTVYLSRVSSAGSEFFVIDVSTPAIPVTVGTLELGATAYNMVASGNFVYVASGHDTQELQIINITTPASPILSGFLDLSGTTDASAIGVASGIVTIGQGNNFYTVNVANPVSPVQLGSVSIGGTINDIVIGDNTSVFVASSNPAKELQVVDISTPSSPTSIGSYDISGVGTNTLNGLAYSSFINRLFGASSSDSKELTIFAPQ